MPASSAVTRSAPLLAWSLAGVIVCGSIVAVLLGEGGDGDSWKAVLAPWMFAVPGALVAAARPGNPLGWLMLVVAACFAGTALTSSWVEQGDGGAWAVWFIDRASAVLVPATLGVLLLLPTGHLPSPRWRPLALLALGSQLLLVLVWCLVEGPAAAPDTSLSSAGGFENPVGVLPSSWGGVVVGLEWLLQLPLLLGLVALAVRLSLDPPTDRVTVSGFGEVAGLALGAWEGCRSARLFHCRPWSIGSGEAVRSR